MPAFCQTKPVNSAATGTPLLLISLGLTNLLACLCLFLYLSDLVSILNEQEFRRHQECILHVFARLGRRFTPVVYSVFCFEFQYLLVSDFTVRLSILHVTNQYDNHVLLCRLLHFLEPRLQVQKRILSRNIVD